MNEAKKRRGQGSGAEAVRRAYAAAVTSLSRVQHGAYDVSADRRIVTALAAARGAFDSLAAAARAGESDRYARRRRAAAAAEDHVRRGLEDLEALGTIASGS